VAQGRPQSASAVSGAGRRRSCRQWLKWRRHGWDLGELDFEVHAYAQRCERAGVGAAVRRPWVGGPGHPCVVGCASAAALAGPANPQQAGGARRCGPGHSGVCGGCGLGAPVHPGAASGAPALAAPRERTGLAAPADLAQARAPATPAQGEAGYGCGGSGRRQRAEAAAFWASRCAATSGEREREEGARGWQRRRGQAARGRGELGARRARTLDLGRRKGRCRRRRGRAAAGGEGS